MYFGKFEISEELEPLFNFYPACLSHFVDLDWLIILLEICWCTASCCSWSLLSIPSSLLLVSSVRSLFLDSTAPACRYSLSYCQTWVLIRCYSSSWWIPDSQHHYKCSIIDFYYHKHQPSSQMLSFSRRCPCLCGLCSHGSDKRAASSVCWCSGCCSSCFGPLLVLLCFLSQIFAGWYGNLVQFYFEFLRFGWVSKLYWKWCISANFENSAYPTSTWNRKCLTLHLISCAPCSSGFDWWDWGCQKQYSTWTLDEMCDAQAHSVRCC